MGAAYLTAVQHGEVPEQPERRRQGPWEHHLLRWEPRLLGLLEELAAGTIGTSEFPVLGESASPPKIGAAGADRHTTLVVFVVGGVTLPEVRVAHELSRSSNLEVYIGGNSILTAETLLRAL